MTFKNYLFVSAVISFIIALALDYWASYRRNVDLDSKVRRRIVDTLVVNPITFLVSFLILCLIGVFSPTSEKENVHTVYKNEANASAIVSYDFSNDELKGGSITKYNKQIFIKHNKKKDVTCSPGSIRLSKDNTTVMRNVDDIVLKGKEGADYVSRIDYGTRTITSYILGFIPLKLESMDIVNVYLVPHKVDNRDKDNTKTLNNILDNNKG
jgi:hypothetical protein